MFLICRALVAAALLAILASTLSVYPHQLAYFNELAGGPKNGHKHLLHSNLDWGQDLLYLKDWLKRQPVRRPLYFAYCSNTDPRFLGIPHEKPPQHEHSSPDEEETFIRSLPPGWYAVSENYVHGFAWQVPQDCFTYVKQLHETGRCGHSIRIYVCDDRSTTFLE